MLPRKTLPRQYGESEGVKVKNFHTVPHLFTFLPYILKAGNENEDKNEDKNVESSEK